MNSKLWGKRSAALYGAPEEHALMTEINTTPLVDVMLVLLIIFLITVPVATASIAVQLPLERTEQRQLVPGILTISVDRQGQIYLDRLPVADGPELSRQLLALGDPDRPVHLVADMNARYVQIEPALRAARQAGMRQVSFVTDPADR